MNQKYHYQILSTMANRIDPVGAGTLSKELRLKEINLSEATVGRILSEMDEQGLTIKVGYQGRRLTDQGGIHLRNLKKEKNRHMQSRELLSLLQEKGHDNLLELLVARRAIERELARLAALNATDEEIAELSRITKLQEERYGQVGTSPEEDVKFHRYIAQAAKNKVLQAAMELIRENGQLSPVLEYIRTEVRSVIAIDHKQIIEAIVKRDPDAADQAMVRHIENLMADVEKYYHKA